ncbi:MAG: SAM-dependent methyltransferase [Alphaproteobacteria bacterium]|nr:SAM-dependent methyltransferase [Alphaproteobacteria bacterium]
MNMLDKIIRDLIAAQGAISIASYMELALQHPEFGYYKKREPIGRTGDFITAPEVSQLFGEMLGVWCAEAWRTLGKPEPFALVELGPGRGTMMVDILRATINVGGFKDARKIYLVESDEALRARQKEVLGDVTYIDDLDQAPQMPLLIVANEFFDSLPVRQFEKTFRGWAERVVTVSGDALAIALRPLNEAEMLLIPQSFREAEPGKMFEFSPSAQAIVREAARALVSRKGKMLLIDYGYVAPSGASTVQALSNHVSTDILDRPGEVDLTAHVDFSTLTDIARAHGAKTSAIVGQGEFLTNCGIELRADALKKHATPKQAADIHAGLQRLIDDDQMGSLFKVVEITG